MKNFELEVSGISRFLVSSNHFTMPHEVLDSIRAFVEAADTPEKHRYRKGLQFKFLYGGNVELIEVFDMKTKEKQIVLRERID